MLSEPSPDWTGRVGLVHNAVREDHPDLAVTDVYACGNPMMVKAAQRDFVAHHGLPEAQFFADALQINPNSARAHIGVARNKRIDGGEETLLYNGDNYEWYDSGWNGPGYYIVGYQFRRGHGYGGGESWHGWRHPHHLGGGFLLK